MLIDRNKVGAKFLVATHDLVVLNVWVCISAFAASFIDDPNWQLDYQSLSTLTSVGYLVGLYFTPIIMDRTSLRINAILRRCVSIGVVIYISYLALVALLKLDVANLRHNFLVVAFTPLVLFASRLLVKWQLDWCHELRGFRGRLVLVGRSDAMLNLYHALVNTTDSQIVGYFADGEMDVPLKRLGEPEQMLEHLGRWPVDEVYCDFTLDGDYLARLYMWCENNFVRFFGVPDAYAFLNRRLLVSKVENVPVLAVRDEPLCNPFNRFAKRFFDIVFSGLVLTVLFPPILLISAIKIKRSSPGPVFFRQKRTGADGREFLCWKFRSMHVNAQADTLQATKDDPRKFPYGDFMRRTNIDELPQFINVFLGDMSVVGPRPHPLRLNEKFEAIIKRYQVRHWVKPGVTGWAQVCGLRGETRELRDMERRVRHDIWYVGHWTFWLDLRIIFMTALQTVSGRSKNAY